MYNYTYTVIIIYLYLYGCFLKWWYPPNTPKWSFLVRKPMVVWYHHFRNPPYYLLLWVASFKPGPHRSGMVSSWRHVEHQDLPLQRRRIADWRFEVCVLKKIPVVFFALMFFVSHFSIGDSGSWMILGQCSFGFLHPPGLLFGRWGLWHSLRMATGLWADAGQNLLKFYGYVQRRWVSTFHVIPGDGEGNAKVWPTSSGLHGAFVATSVDLKGLRELGEWKIQIRLQMCDVVSLGWELWTHSCGRWCFFFSVVPYSSCFSCWFVLFCFVLFISSFDFTILVYFVESISEYFWTQGVESRRCQLMRDFCSWAEAGTEVTAANRCKQVKFSIYLFFSIRA